MTGKLIFGLSIAGMLFAAAPEDTAAPGKAIFVKVGCYACHGREAQGGGAYGPRLAPSPIPFPAFLKFVRKPSGEMPSYSEKVLPDAELARIYAFLQAQPGPPPVNRIRILK